MRAGGPLRIAFVMALAACGQDSVTAPAPAPVVNAMPGVYQLVSLNGLALPAISSQSRTETFEIVSDELVILSNGMWSELTNYRITSRSSVATAQGAGSGTYTTINGQLRFSAPGGTPFDVSFKDGKITMLPAALVMVFEKAKTKP